MKTARPAVATTLVPPFAAAVSQNRHPARLAMSLALAAALVGCGSTAGIRRTDGNVVEAKIVGSDAEGLELEGAFGQTYRMNGRAVVDVDHPGNVAMVAGALLLGEVAVLMTSRDFRHELINGPHGDGMVAARPLTAMFGIPGALLFGYGTYRYVSSKRAAAAFEDGFERAAERPLPSASGATPAVKPASRPAEPTALPPPTPQLSLAGTLRASGEPPCEETRLTTFCPAR